MSKGNYEIIKKSNLFDEEWYTSEYLENNDEKPIKHYIDIGWKKATIHPPTLTHHGIWKKMQMLKKME